MQVLDRLFYKKNEGAPFITTHPLFRSLYHQLQYFNTCNSVKCLMV